MTQAYDYDTANPIGVASEELVTASYAAGDTGAVPAYRDAGGVWQYVAPQDVEHYRRHLGCDVITVYVEREEAAHTHEPYSHHGGTFRCLCGATSHSGAGPWAESDTRACAVCAAPTVETGATPLCAWHREVAS